MTKRSKIGIVLLILLLVSSLAIAASIKIGQTGQSEQTVHWPDIPRVLPQCCDPSTALQCINRLNVAKPIRAGDLWVFPITGSACSNQRFLSLDEALARKELIIRELGSGTVSSLEAENRGDRYVLLMAGEFMHGGKQNRIVASDVLIPPHSGPITIPVFCGERRRWTKTTGDFAGQKSLAPAKLRGEVYNRTTQDKVWSGISRRMKENKVDAPTENLQQLYEQGKNADLTRECERKVRGRFPYNTLGMVVFEGRQMIGVELFATRHLFAALNEKVLRSYFLDYASNGCKPGLRHGKPISVSEVPRTLQSLVRAHFNLRPTPGAGCLYEFGHAGVSGQALILACDPVHVGGIGHARRLMEGK